MANTIVRDLESLSVVVAEAEKEKANQSFSNWRCGLQRELFINSMIRVGDRRCITQLRMSQYAFDQLCALLKEKTDLRSTRHLTVEDQMAMFLHTLAHNVRNRCIGQYFCRSGETVHRHFHRCLKAILKIYKDCIDQPHGQTPPQIASNPYDAPYFQVYTSEVIGYMCLLF